MTDQEHAKSINEKAKALNVAIRAAHEDGLRIELTGFESTEFGRPLPLIWVVPGVFREMTR